MDFLKTCRTNTTAIAGFDAVSYQAFSVARAPIPPDARIDDRAPPDPLRAVEAELRQQDLLVAQDVKVTRKWLWLFRATAVDKTGDKPPHLPTVGGYVLQPEQFGVVKAAEFSRPQYSKSANPSTPSPATLQQQQQQQRTEFVLAVYEMFTSSVVALISYYLVKHYNAVALNYRTFLIKPTLRDPDSETASELASTPYSMTNLSVYWASSGPLLVSVFSVAETAIQCLHDFSTPELQRGCIGKCIRIAPNGSLAQVVAFDDPLKVAAEVNGQKPPRKRLKLGPLERDVEKWRSAVSRWLSRKGYSLTLENNMEWVRIRPAQCSPPTASDSYLSNHPRDIWWPRALCFLHGASEQAKWELESLVRSTCNPLDWFATPESSGYRDPIDTIEQWFLGKPEREKALEARRRAKAEAEMPPSKEEHPGSQFASSPLNARGPVYSDLQAAGGMYPTPPDGVAPGTVPSLSDTPGMPGAKTVLVQPGENNPAINLSAPHTSNLKAPPSTTSPDFRYETFHSAGGNDDDLFEDTDEDGFGGNGVTDADFNFFDEPGDDDLDMHDAPPLQDSLPDIPNNPAWEKQPQTASEVDIKEEMSDPMAALENALASASNSSDHDTSMVDASDAQPSSVRVKHDVAPVQPERTQIQRSDVVKTEPPPTSDLRPIHQDQISPERDQFSVHGTKKHDACHRESVFDPVIFDRKMSLSDAKYQNGRFSFPHEKPGVGKTDTNTSRNDVPLLTIPRYVRSAQEVPFSPGGESSDSASEISSFSADEDDEEDDEEEEETGRDTVSLSGSLPVAIIAPGTIGKRKVPTDGNRTPLSATSYADSFGGDALEFVGVQTDEGSLSLLEPNPWDWSLTDLPPPTELRTAIGRHSVPSFSPAVTSSLPNTPTSQPDVYHDPSEEKPLSRNDCIAVAQVVTDQIVSATLDILHEDAASFLKPVTEPPNSALFAAVKNVFPNATDYDVAALAAVADIYPDLPSQAKGPQRAPPRKPNDALSFTGFHFFALQPPYIRVRRSENLWELLPPAVAFWESLGLAPCSAPKNVGAFCIYPHSDALVSYLESFMVNLKIAYEGCKLGNHDRVEDVPGFEGGLVPWEVDMPVSRRAAFRSMRDTCMALGKALATKYSQTVVNDDTQKAHALVIYMVSPFEDPSAIWELGAAFWTLFQAYGQGPSARNGNCSKPDLVLQIVPIKYIASFDVPVILNASSFASLAREVYDRCPPSAPSKDRSPLSIYAAPCFQLEEPPPRKIDFKIQSEPPQDLLRENSYMHVGYAISLDGNWVSAAWTDSCGKSRTVVSYHLGTRPFIEIAKEIWQTTLDMCQVRKVTWRVCIAKSGAVEREELEAWHYLSAYHNQVTFLILLLTVNPDASFYLTPMATAQTGAGPASTSSPTATPQAGVSPESQNPTPGATPAPESTDDMTNDPDARLVDVTDESWGIILAHRLHNTNSTVDFRPCLISGLLVKRGLVQQHTPPLPSTPDPELGPLAVAVSIIFMGTSGNKTGAAVNINVNSPLAPLTPTSMDGISPGGSGSGSVYSSSPGPTTSQVPEKERLILMWTPTPATRATAESLLKEVLAHYRALGTLARLKGIRGTRMGTVPWHVAVAKRGVEGLGRCVGGVV